MVRLKTDTMLHDPRKIRDEVLIQTKGAAIDWDLSGEETAVSASQGLGAPGRRCAR